MSLQVSNDHNVYILGAGFSVSAGLPTVGDFLNRMRDALEWWQKRSGKSECEAIEQVLQYRLKAASAAYWSTLDLENIEQLFSLASAARDPVSGVLPRALAATLEYARQQGSDQRVRVVLDDNETSTRLHVSPAGLEPVWRPEAPQIFQRIEKIEREGKMAFQVASLLGMINEDSMPTGQNTFISFNYDTLVEDALTRLHVPWTYGFEWNRVNFRQGSASEWGRAKDPNAVPVLKLHGSVNWGRGGPGGDRLSVFDSYGKLAGANAIPRLIPPTWSKDANDQISSVWEKAIARLRTATRVVIVGFSIPETDLHFRYLLAAGLQENAWLRSILFVNPDREGIEKRVRAILRPGYVDQKLIRFAAQYAEGFADSLAKNGGYLGQTENFDIGRKPQAKLGCWAPQRH